MSAPVSVGVVGLGYWGPNLARNFAALPESELTWICDGSEEQLMQVAPRFPGVRTTTSLDDLLTDPKLDAVAIATPVPTHAELAVRVLGAGKHCFVEKPLAQSVADAEEVADAALASGRTLMVGHLLEYHPGLELLKQLVDGGELGDIQYIYGNRLNLGKLRADENALWSLGAHDVSVVLRLAGEEPVECHAHGASYMREGVEDVVFCDLRFPSGLAAHLHLSWLDPHKERRFTVVGSRRMATFDDMADEQKLTVYDKGFDQRSEGLRRVRPALGRRVVPAGAGGRAAADRMQSLRRAGARRRSATLRRRRGGQGGAGAGGPAALARDGHSVAAKPMSESTVALASTQTKPCVTKAGRLKVMRRKSSPMSSRPMKNCRSHLR